MDSSAKDSQSNENDGKRLLTTTLFAMRDLDRKNERGDEKGFTAVLVGLGVFRIA